jgi:hypothetical protein
MVKNSLGQNLTYAQFAPASLNWSKQQILELQKLINLGIDAWMHGQTKLQEDGIYGPKTREMLGGMLKGMDITEPSKLVEILRQKFTKIANRSVSKYQRHQPIISRNADEEAGEDNWLNQLDKKLNKEAVQPKRIDQSLFDQMNSIMNGKSKHTSVEAAVEDMKQRSGLTAYLEKVKLSEEENRSTTIKKASDNNSVMEKKVDLTPVLLKKVPSIKSTIENYIRDTKGNLPVPAIIDKIRTIHQNDVSDAKDWDDDKLIIYVSNLNLKAKKDNPAVFQNYENLGSRDQNDASEIDPSNTDAFHALNPVKF